MIEAATVGEALAEARHRLDGAGIASARIDARVLLAHVLDAEPASVLGRGRHPLPAAARRNFAGLVSRRLGREPIAHITGHREFWSLSFEVTADTLVPRPDSETVVEAALAWSAGHGVPASVLDLGTGSGCLLLALLSELAAACGTGIDVSPPALAVAGRNAARLGLAGRARFVCDDWGASLAGPFEMIVSNPPYIAAADAPEGAVVVDPEVAGFEPKVALYGGAEGFDCHCSLAPQAARLLAPEGALFLEIGYGQAAEVTALLSKSALEVIEIKKDYSGIPRCVVARRRGR
ncbi:MAG TPA: peptide chain release factor N(5)-glutamine methyltransferase [Rhodospirillales bacterium]|jgi:release factor glutamine methyltransferase|nr:peptide chain release factor N(5)-glutamine methyltransferase [Rhodospirillales bacterium]